MFQMPNKLMKNQRGNALLITLGLVLFVGVVAAEVFRRIEASQTRVARNLDLELARETHRSLRASLQSPELCSHALRDQTVSPGGSALVSLNFSMTPRPAGATGDLKPLVSGDEIVPEQLLLREVRVSTGLDSTDYRATVTMDGNSVVMTRYKIRLDTVFQGRRPGNIPLRFNQAPGATYDPAMARELFGWMNPSGSLTVGQDRGGIELFAWVDPNMRIHTCFGLNSVGAMCNATGGFYRVDLATTGSNHLACANNTSLELVDGTYMGNCRVGGVVRGTSNCDNLHGQQWTPVEIHETIGGGSPRTKILCMSCDGP
jgi:hypothetical protein